jgi:hypothetical protein
MGIFEVVGDPIRSDAGAVAFASTAGVISIGPEKGPVRTIITGGKLRATGRFFSVKNGRSMPWEAEREEPLAFASAEVETNCLAWIGQPCRIEIPFGSAWLWYFPDLARRDRVENRWITRVIELKRDKKIEVENNPDYEEKLGLAKDLLGKVRATFEILENADLGTPVYRRNVLSIVLDKNTKVEASDIARARDVAASSCGHAAYGELCEALGGFIIGKKKVHAMMVRRILRIPLDREITVSSAVSLVDRSHDPQHDWEFFE